MKKFNLVNLIIIIVFLVTLVFLYKISGNVFDNRVNALKQNLFNTMKSTGKTKFATDLFSFNIAKNGGKQTLTIDGYVPEEYTKTIVENDTDKIRADLEAGKELSFAHLEPRGESLRIK